MGACAAAVQVCNLCLSSTASISIASSQSRRRRVCNRRRRECRQPYPLVGVSLRNHR